MHLHSFLQILHDINDILRANIVERLEQAAALSQQACEICAEVFEGRVPDHIIQKVTMTSAAMRRILLIYSQTSARKYTN